MFEKNPGNVQEDSGECSKRFKGMFKKIPGNVQEDSRECSRRFRVMLKKISGDLNLDTFCEILLIFNQILQIAKNTKEYFLRYYILGNYKIQSIKNYTQSFKINIEKQLLELFCTKRCSSRFCKFHRKFPTSVLESPWRSPWSLFRKKLQAASLKACKFVKKRPQQLFSCEICEIFKRT